MKYFITILIGILISSHLYVGCKDVNSKKLDEETASLEKANLQPNKFKENISSKFEEDSLDLSNIYNSYLESYKDSIKIDTTFIFRDSEVELYLQHYCTYDSSLRVPEKYVKIYGIKEFVTHNFESFLQIRVNNKYVIDTIIRKSMFEDTLSVPLKKYGALLYPVLSFKKDDQIQIDYSLSIPLTDVGRLVSFSLVIGHDKLFF